MVPAASATWSAVRSGPIRSTKAPGRALLGETPVTSRVIKSIENTSHHGDPLIAEPGAATVRKRPQVAVGISDRDGRDSGRLGGAMARTIANGPVSVNLAHLQNFSLAGEPLAHGIGAAGDRIDAVVPGVALVVVAAAAVGFGLAAPITLAHVPSLLFLDVGHGDAVLLRSGRHAWLIDAGPRFGSYDAGRLVVAPALRAEGVHRLDALVLTHADRDHIGGAVAVLGAVPVDEIWLSAPTLNAAPMLEVRRAAAERGVPLRVVDDGYLRRAAGLTLRVLWPPPHLSPGPDNRASLVLRVESAHACVMLPGDVPADVERRQADLEGRGRRLRESRRRRDSTPGTFPAGEERRLRVRVLARLVDSLARDVQFTFVEHAGGRTERRAWSLRDVRPGGEELLADWATLRALTWHRQDPDGASILLDFWQSRARPLYGAETPWVLQRDGRRDEPQVAGLASLLGGQPAMRETLQMELIGAPDEATDGLLSIPLAEVAELDVQSHPFGEMLAGRRVEVPRLATLVPRDRAFLHLLEPGALLGFLREGAPAVARFTTMVTGSGLDHGLERRYAEALGLTPVMMRDVLSSGAVEEVGIFVPDLFFVDGTDLTVLALLGDGPAVDLLFGFGQQERGVREVATPSGATSHWARRGRLLVLGTSRSEVEAVLALHDRGGKEGLGDSEEFRFMLHSVPDTPETVARVYLSDAFLRRLTGPEVKIGQLRRARERVAMEAVVAAQLLRRADGAPDVVGIPRLLEQGYLDPQFGLLDLALAATGTVTSPRWGELDRMLPLSAHPVTNVSKRERDLYRRYVDEYQRYWRRFYDPIAIRYDRRQDGTHEVTTFILPLLNNSIYDVLREMVPPTSDAPLLRIPQFDPPPVLTLSAQLPEMAWIGAAHELRDLFDSYGTVDPTFFDLLGPQVHLVVLDDEPLVRLGSGEIAGMASVAQDRISDEMFWIPILAAVLTRPCELAIEVSDPALARRALEGLRPSRRDEDFFVIESVRVGEGARRVFTLNLLGTVKWDVSIDVRENWLVLSNHPWTRPAEFIGVEQGSLRGMALHVDVDAVARGELSAWASHAESSRAEIHRAMAQLLPWLVAGAATPEAAGLRSRKIVGRRPVLPEGSELAWSGGLLTSAEYGRPLDPRQPEFDPDRPFGLFQDLHDLDIAMEIEEDGLRTVVRWSPKE